MIVRGLIFELFRGLFGLIWWLFRELCCGCFGAVVGLCAGCVGNAFVFFMGTKPDQHE